MTTLQDFDSTLSAISHGDAWDANGVVLARAAAERLGEQDLQTLQRIWTHRPPLWKQRCAEVMGSNRLDQAIEILLAMVDQSPPKVALAALESLREFDPRRFTTQQSEHILLALDSRLGQPMELLHRVVLEAFAATLNMR